MGEEGTGAGTTGTGTQPGVTPPPATSQGVTPPTTPTPPAMGNQTTAPTIPDGNVDALPDWAKTLIGNLRKSEQKLRTFEDRDKTEAQKLQDRITELEGQLGTATGTIRDYTLSGKFEGEAAKAGAIDPKLLYQVAKGQITTDKDGNPTNLADVLKTLKASHPTQFRQVRQTPNIDAAAGTGTGSGNGSGTGSGVSITDWMRGQVRPGAG